MQSAVVDLVGRCLLLVDPVQVARSGLRSPKTRSVEPCPRLAVGMTSASAAADFQAVFVCRLLGPAFCMELGVLSADCRFIA